MANISIDRTNLAPRHCCTAPAGSLSGMIVVGRLLVVPLLLAGRLRHGAESPASAVKQALSRGTAAKTAGRAGTNVGPHAPKKNPVAAVVNNEPISREDLARECLLHYGTDVLESMVNRTLILTSCQQRNIVITDEQVDEEIDRMARKFSLAKDQWLKMLEKERGIKPDRYAQDIIWPTLALRELAKDQLTVSKQELDEAYESEFGPAVKVRLIAHGQAEEAQGVHAQAMAKPEDFGALAKKHSQGHQQRQRLWPDSADPPAHGRPEPGDSRVRAEEGRNLGDRQGRQPVRVHQMRRTLAAAAKGVDRAKVDPLLLEAHQDRKLRAAASDVFKELQKKAVVENVYNDPVKSKQMPGVAAMINGQKITHSRAGRRVHRPARQRRAGRHDQPPVARPGPAQTQAQSQRRRDRQPKSAGPPSRWARPRPTASPTSMPGSSTSPRPRTSARSLRSRRGLALGGAEEAGRRQRARSPRKT